MRKAAVQLLSTAAHNKPGLIVGNLPSVLPLLYQQTVLNPALVRYRLVSSLPPDAQKSISYILEMSASLSVSVCLSAIPAEL